MLSVFDLDHTLVVGNSSFQFCQYLSRRGVLPTYTPSFSSFYYLQHRFFGLDLTGLHHKVFNRFLKGRPLEQLEECVEPFIQEKIRPSLYAPAIECLRRAQHLGHKTLILSNSPHFLVSKIARFLGVDEWDATQYAVDAQNALCHIARVVQGEEKAAFVCKIAKKLHLDKTEITAYSDSYLDLPFLLSAGNVVAVNPDRKLLRLSKRRCWTVI
jgi:HAD superfamily hydrolase (TIGR01490 family)